MIALLERIAEAVESRPVAAKTLSNVKFDTISQPKQATRRSKKLEFAIDHYRQHPDEPRSYRELEREVIMPDGKAISYGTWNNARRIANEESS